MKRLGSVLVAGAALAGVAVTFALGVWQWGRAEEKLALRAAVEARESMGPLSTEAVLALSGATPNLLHRPVVVHGRWVGRHTVFLDNRQMNGRPGFYVVTPLRLEGYETHVLVQRGWVPRDFERRDRLPAVETPDGVVQVAGRMAPWPGRLYQLGDDNPGVIRQNVDPDRFEQETGLSLLPLTVQQLGSPSEGLLREWPQPASTAGKNYGYAFQWWALSALIVFLYVWFGFIAPRRKARRA